MTTATDLHDRVSMAVAKANSAHERIDGHEELCAIRYNALQASVSDLKAVLAWAVGGILVLLLTVLGWLIIEKISANSAEQEALRIQIHELQVTSKDR